MSATRSFDVVVVGGGSAGCVVARRLVDAGRTVAIVEAGPAGTDAAIRHPERCFELPLGRYDWCDVTAPQPHLGGRAVEFARGKVLGGSSSINNMIYARGSRVDFDGWKAEGNPGWGYEDLLPLFRRLEDYDGDVSEARGVGGPITVTSRYERHPVMADLIDACGRAGVAHNPDYNAGSLEGASFMQFNIRDRRRLSAADAFLGAVLDEPKLTVLTECTARRLLFEAGRCVGVEVSRGANIERLNAETEVVLCAGAFGSPALLLRSGVGPANDLRALGIELEAGLPGVGANLHDHVLVPLSAHAARPFPPPASGAPGYQVTGFLRSRDDLVQPDIQFQAVHLPLPSGDDGLTVLVILVAPESRGRLRLAARDPSSPAIIDPNYLAVAQDTEALVAGLGRVRDVLREPPICEWLSERAVPETDDAGDLRAFVRQTAGSFWHAAGTCRMGTDEMSVVTPELKIHGVDGLRVADASIMPTVTASNTYAPSVAIGERAAELMLASS